MSNPSSHVKRSWGQRSNLSCFRPQHDEFREPCTKELESGYPDGPYMFDMYLKAEFLHLVHSSTKCIRFLPFSLGADEIVESNPVKAKEAYITYEEMNFPGVFSSNHLWKINESLNGFYLSRSWSASNSDKERFWRSVFYQLSSHRHKVRNRRHLFDHS